MRARVAHDVGQHEGHAGELHAEQLKPLPLSPTLACDAHHAVRSAPMLAPITTSTSSPARLKTRVGGSTSPRAFRVGKIPRQPRAAHRETTTRARRFAVGSRKYLSPEPLLQSPAWVMSELQSGYQVPAYSYARNNPIAYTDPTGLYVPPGFPVAPFTPSGTGLPTHGQPGAQPQTPPWRRTMNPNLPRPTRSNDPLPPPRIPRSRTPQVCFDSASNNCGSLPARWQDTLRAMLAACPRNDGFIECARQLPIAQVFCDLAEECGKLDQYSMICGGRL